MHNQINPRLSIKNISKNFGNNSVLKNVSFDLLPGEITSFIGANGAGKTTLVKILAGIHKFSEGKIEIDGVNYLPTNPTDAMKKGIAIVHQIISEGVIEDMTVYENLVIDRLCIGESDIYFNRSKAKKSAKKIADALDLDLPLNSMTRDLSQAEKQLVAIARSMAHEPKILILDEPSSSLSSKETERLFSLIEKLKNQNVSILYISHKMADIKRLSDKVVALRDGVITGVFKKPINFNEAIASMLGKELANINFLQNQKGEEVIRFNNFQLSETSKEFNLSINKGQVTAITGLVGTGKSEFIECIFGIRKQFKGKMFLNADPYIPKSPKDAIRKKIFLASEDRTKNSLFANFNLFKNIDFPFLHLFSNFSFLKKNDEIKNANKLISLLKVKCENSHQDIGDLSGGNQQKVVLARWLTDESQLLILDEPFQGVDISSRQEIGEILRKNTLNKASLIVCSDLDEVTEVADRILVFSKWALVGDFERNQFNKQSVIDLMSA
jgi:simple sugar transport system ATP-binding protein